MRKAFTVGQIMESYTLFLLAGLSFCALCEAIPAPGRPCRPVLCRMYCPYGWAKNPLTGCDMCKCAKPKCSPDQGMRCQMACRYGFKKDKDGCTICSCRDKPKCSPIMCRMHCPFGFEKDSNGCSLCRCKQRPPGGCPKIRCMKECPNGFVTRHGCPTCRCKEGPPPPTEQCKKKCPKGQECHRQVIYCIRSPCPPPREVCRKKIPTDKCTDKYKSCPRLASRLCRHQIVKKICPASCKVCVPGEDKE